MGNFFNKLDKEDLKEEILEWAYIFIGSLLVAVAINVFFLPNKITNGGASGIATVLYYLYQTPMGLSVMLINIPLFILAIWKLGIKFSIKTIVSTSLLSLFLEIIKVETFIVKYQASEDLFIATIFGGLILGIGLSLVFKGNASTGGSDLLANIIYKWKPNINLSTILLMIDSVIIIFTIIVFKSINIGLYSIIGIYISNKVIDLLFEGINYSKAFYIISSRAKEITEEVAKTLERSTTMVECTGTYTKEKYMLLIVILPRTQLSKMKYIIQKHDKRAFVYISNAHEVLGQGFKEIK